MNKIMCPNTRCTGMLKIPDEHIGKKVVCNKCQTSFRVQRNNGLLSAKPETVQMPVALPKAESAEAPKRKTMFRQNALPLLEELPDDDGLDSPRKTKITLPNRRTLQLWSVGAGIVVVLTLLVVSFFKSSSHEVYGGIEITSSEIRVHEYEFFPDSTLGFDFKRLSDAPWRENFPLKVNKEGDFDPASMKDTVGAIERVNKELQKKHGINSDKIVIACGSGVFKGVQNKEKNRKALNKMVQDATGRSIDFVESSQMELELQTDVLIPEKLLEKTVFVDLGNSGCRGGCPSKKGKPAYLDIMGVKAFTESMMKRAAPGKVTGGRSDKQMELYIKAASEVGDGEFRNALHKALADSGDLNLMLTGRGRIELVGGIPWVIATYKNPQGRDQTHTRLTVGQIDEFYKDIRRLRTYPEFVMPAGVSEELKKKLADDAEAMRVRISQENLIAGTEMLRVLVEELRFGDPGREIYFHNYGQEAVVLSFMQKMWEKTAKK